MSMDTMAHHGLSGRTGGESHGRGLLGSLSLKQGGHRVTIALPSNRSQGAWAARVLRKTMHILAQPCTTLHVSRTVLSGPLGLEVESRPSEAPPGGPSRVLRLSKSMSSLAGTCACLLVFSHGLFK